jgi:hypothetical protein
LTANYIELFTVDGLLDRIALRERIQEIGKH